MKFTADFETCTWLEDETYVWAWAVSEIGNEENIKIGNDIDSFMKYIEYEKNSDYYFHNLKFDGEFIIHYLITHGFEHITDRKEKRDKTFSTLISDMGMFYTIEVFFKVGNKRVKKARFIDSLKIIPFGVDQIAKSFGLPISKLSIDYNEYRERGHILTNQERDYITNDVKIVAMALKVLFNEGLDRITTASNALYDFKKTHKKSNFESMFPHLLPEVDDDLRKAYRGGFTYLNDIYKEIDTGEGVVLDVNSLYPSVMRYELLPIGEPMFYEGKYVEDLVYPLYVQRITCAFELKENKIPTIQIKKSPSFMDNEYLKSSNGKRVSLTLSSVDLKLFLEQYDVYGLKYKSGWKFKAKRGIFNEYIDHWTEVKIQATKEGNKGMRTLAKLMLNSLYGRFAIGLKVQGKIPYLEDDTVYYKLGEEETREGLYLPCGIFITSYARDRTVRTSQAIKTYSIEKYGIDKYCYSDTDSIHCLLPIEELEQFCDIDPVRLGAWKHESTFRKARFVRQKTYLEDMKNEFNKKILKKLKIKKNNKVIYKKFNLQKGYYYEIKITCAGMPKECYKYVEWEKFKQGFTCGGKLMFNHIKGGVKLVETDFTIKRDKTLIKNIEEF